MAKGHLAPMEPTTTPRLKVQAAAVGASLAHDIAKTFHIPDSSIPHLVGQPNLPSLDKGSGHIQRKDAYISKKVEDIRQMNIPERV